MESICYLMFEFFEQLSDGKRNLFEDESLTKQFDEMLMKIETQSRKLSTDMKSQIRSHLSSTLPFGKQVFMEKYYDIEIKVIWKQLRIDMFNMIKEISDTKVGVFDRYKKDVIEFNKRKANGEAVNKIPLKTFPFTEGIKEKFTKVIDICEDLYDLIKSKDPNLTLKTHLDKFFKKFLILDVWEGWIKIETLWKWAKPLIRGQLRTPQSSPEKSDKTSSPPKTIDKSLESNVLNVRQSTLQTPSTASISTPLRQTAPPPPAHTSSVSATPVRQTTQPPPAHTPSVSTTPLRQTGPPPPAHISAISSTAVRQTGRPTALPTPPINTTAVRQTAQPTAVLIPSISATSVPKTAQPTPPPTPSISTTAIRQSSEPTAAPTPAVSSANCVPNEISVKIKSGNTGQQTVVKVIQSKVSPVLKLRLNSNDNSLPSTSKRKSNQMDSPFTSPAIEEPLAKKRRTETNCSAQEVTQKLSINTSNEEQVCDQNVDKISPKSESKRRSKRLKGKSEQTSDSPKTSRPDFEEHNRAFQRWICRTDVVKSPYLPQIGDRVVYLRPGHYEYIEWLKKKGLTSYLPNQMKSYKNPRNETKESDHIFAIIKSIDFKSNPINAIKLSLQLDQTSEAPDDTTVFEIEYSFLDNSEEISDFIILRQTYDMGINMSGLIREGEPFVTIVNDFGWVKCTVISESDFSKFFPTSLYKRFFVNLSDNSSKRLSPWDLSNVWNPNALEEDVYPSLELDDNDKMGFYISTPEDWPHWECNEQTVQDIRQFACVGWAREFDKLLNTTIGSSFANASDIYPDPKPIYPIDLMIIKKRLKNVFYRRFEQIKFDLIVFRHNLSKQSFDRKNAFNKLFDIIIDYMKSDIYDSNTSIMSHYYKQFPQTDCHQTVDSDSEMEIEVISSPHLKRLYNLSSSQVMSKDPMVSTAKSFDPRVPSFAKTETTVEPNVERNDDIINDQNESEVNDSTEGVPPVQSVDSSSIIRNETQTDSEIEGMESMETPPTETPAIETVEPVPVIREESQTDPPTEDMGTDVISAQEPNPVVEEAQTNPPVENIAPQTSQTTITQVESVDIKPKIECPDIKPFIKIVPKVEPIFETNEPKESETNAQNDNIKSTPSAETATNQITAQEVNQRPEPAPQIEAIGSQEQPLVEPRIEDKTYLCVFCGEYKSFMDRNESEVHYKSHFPKQIQCVLCDKTHDSVEKFTSMDKHWKSEENKIKIKRFFMTSDWIHSFHDFQATDSFVNSFTGRVEYCPVCKPINTMCRETSTPLQESEVQESSEDHIRRHMRYSRVLECIQCSEQSNGRKNKFCFDLFEAQKHLSIHDLSIELSEELIEQYFRPNGSHIFTIEELIEGSVDINNRIKSLFNSINN